jgi:hypothetical protein
MNRINIYILHVFDNFYGLISKIKFKLKKSYLTMLIVIFLKKLKHAKLSYIKNIQEIKVFFNDEFLLIILKSQIY